MFVIFYIFLLCCCNKGEVKGALVVKNRTSVALAKETLFFHLSFKVPVNSSSTASCYQKTQEIWKHTYKAGDSARGVNTVVNMTMHNSSNSGEYFCKTSNPSEKFYFVVLVRDVGYEPNEAIIPTDSSVIPLLIVTFILLLFSIIGSALLFKWHKPEKVGDGVKDRKKESPVGVMTQSPNSESVYTSLEPRPVSIYDVLSVDEARKQSTEKHTSEEKAEACHVGEGIFESVYENL
ncbi:NFAT activation molecule 1 [Hoplias malabaricus]|uniref:NFAT activation molecule 1 n=1 Tax=Hoplias malabaricus TaxID=27720 RepID=UPI0034620539